MGRILGALAAAAVLPACGDYKVSVRNVGLFTARVGVHFEVHHEDDEGRLRYVEPVYRTWEVAPGQTRAEHYGTLPLDVRITRVGDGFLLYEGSLEIDEFMEDHGHVEFTVNP